MPSEGVTELDGRQSRTAQSRLAICEACLDLVQAGALQPSADQIAERAGVSRRSIFNHFADLAELYDAVVEEGMKRFTPLQEEISATEPIARRVESLTRVRAAFLEATAPFSRALTAQALVGAAADQALRVSREALRRQYREVERLFGRELAALPEAERAEILEAISAALAPVLWGHLRRGRGNSLASARAIMKRTVTAILRDAGVPL